MHSIEIASNIIIIVISLSISTSIVDISGNFQFEIRMVRKIFEFSLQVFELQCTVAFRFACNNKINCFNPILSRKRSGINLIVLFIAFLRVETAQTDQPLLEFLLPYSITIFGVHRSGAASPRISIQFQQIAGRKKRNTLNEKPTIKLEIVKTGIAYSSTSRFSTQSSFFLCFSSRSLVCFAMILWLTRICSPTRSLTLSLNTNGREMHNHTKRCQ